MRRSASLRRAVAARERGRRSARAARMRDDSGPDALAILRLQRTAGNAAVSWLLDQGRSGRPLVLAQRQTQPPAQGIPASQLGAFGAEDATEFRRQVYAAQLQWNQQRRKQFFPGVAKDDLQTVEGRFKLHVDAAGDARALLQAARSDLEAAKGRGEPTALAVSGIGLASAYRSLKHDFDAWQKAFAVAYKRTASKRGRLTDPHGPEAVQMLVLQLANAKALPGYSNHTKGLAIDVAATEGGHELGPSHSDDQRWADSWFHDWLTKHAGEYGFVRYKKELWHWDHVGARD